MIVGVFSGGRLLSFVAEADQLATSSRAEGSIDRAS